MVSFSTICWSNMHNNLPFDTSSFCIPDKLVTKPEFHEMKLCSTCHVDSDVNDKRKFKNMIYTDCNMFPFWFFIFGM